MPKRRNLRKGWEILYYTLAEVGVKKRDGLAAVGLFGVTAGFILLLLPGGYLNGVSVSAFLFNVVFSTI